MFPLRSPFFSPRCGSYSPHNLVIQTDGSVAFPLCKDICGVLANWSLCDYTFLFGRTSLFKFFRSSPRYAVSSPLISAAAPTSCHFSSSTLALFSPMSFLLSQTLWQKLSFFFFYQATMDGHLFLPGNDAANESTRRGVLFLQSHVVSLLQPLVSTVLFRTEGVPSHLNSFVTIFFGLQWGTWASSFVPSPVFAATDTAFCYALISLELAESSILHAEPAIIRSRTHFHSALSSYGLFAPRALVVLCLYDLWSRPWASMVFRHAPIH